MKRILKAIDHKKSVLAFYFHWILQKILPKKNEAPQDWIVVFRGKDLARLTNPSFEDMFWLQFDLIPIVGLSEQDYQDLYEVMHWDRCEIKFRSARTGLFAENALISGGSLLNIPKRPKKINIRGLS